MFWDGVTVARLTRARDATQSQGEVARIIWTTLGKGSGVWRRCWWLGSSRKQGCDRGWPDGRRARRLAGSGQMWAVSPEQMTESGRRAFCFQMCHRLAHRLVFYRRSRDSLVESSYMKETAREKKIYLLLTHEWIPFFFFFAVSTTFPVPWASLMCCIINSVNTNRRPRFTRHSSSDPILIFSPPGGEEHICNMNVKAGENNAWCQILWDRIQDPFLCENESDMDLIQWLRL